MKSIHKIIILLFLIKVTIVNAQFKEKNALYTSGEINIGNYVGIDINLNYVYKNNYSFKMDILEIYENLNHNPKITRLA